MLVVPDRFCWLCVSVLAGAEAPAPGLEPLQALTSNASATLQQVVYHQAAIEHGLRLHPVHSS